jgi:hypothetical protein
MNELAEVEGTEGPPVGFFCSAMAPCLSGHEQRLLGLFG